MGAVRADLFDRVDRIAAILESDTAPGDEIGRLPDTTVEALRSAGLLGLKVPAELGGFEAEPPLQYEVFERVAYHSIAAAWCLFIFADTAGMVCARLPDAGLTQLLRGGAFPVCCGGGALKPGNLDPSDGGVLLSGRWRYGSGIHGAEWVMVSGYLPGEGGGRGQVLNCVVPRDSIEVHDTWHVHGLKATGSDDFSADQLFVPREMTFVASAPPRRGGRQYRTGIVGYLAYTVPAVCGAVARRCLDELVAGSATLVRGYTKPSALAQRGAFQRFLGEADMKLRAAKALMLADGHDLMHQVDQPGVDLRAREAQTRAAAAYATWVANDVVRDVARFAGGDALRSGRYFERALRDVTMAASHLLMNEVAYENHAQFVLGIPGADPMA